MKSTVNPKSVMNFIYSYIMRSERCAFTLIDQFGDPAIREYDFHNMYPLKTSVFTYFRVDLINVQCTVNSATGERRIYATFTNVYEDPFDTVTYNCMRTSSDRYSIESKYTSYE